MLRQVLTRMKAKFEKIENLKTMNTEEIILKIKECIKMGHEFSNNLEGKDTIHRNYLTNCFKDYNTSSTDIHVALLEMKELKEIEYDGGDVIILTKNYKHKIEK